MNRHLRAYALLFLAATATPAAAQNWVDLSAAGTSPAARAYASAILDPATGKVVIFGGQTGGTFLGDIWSFDPSDQTWTNLTPVSGSAPAGRRTPGSVFDPISRTMITWSGQATSVFFNDVWAFDLDAGTWALRSPAGGPPNVRYGVALAFDPAARELVTFAGFTNLGRFDDVWRYDDIAATWSDVSPVVSGPIERCLHTACYDPVGHRLIMYGGQNSGALDDIWALDLTSHTWTNLTPTVRPAGRFFAASACDTQNRRMTVFGGTTTLGKVNEAWVFDLWTGAWTQLSPSGTAPSAREGSAGVYDAANDRMIVFGGNDSGGSRNDVWAIDNLSATVTGIATPRRPDGIATLLPAFPNPFNPTTTIQYQLAASARVTVAVYDISGALVRTLFAGVSPAGSYALAWSGKDNRGGAVASGAYIVRLDAASERLSQKIILVK